VAAEAETAALLGFLLAEGRGRVSSAVARVEVLRAVRRAGPFPETLARAAALLERIALVRLDEAVIERAAALEPATLRSLDSLHLATALSLREDLLAFVTYDRRLGTAATEAGLAVAAPGLAPTGRRSPSR
jgi:predicted nucleic acid-binding protein